MKKRHGEEAIIYALKRLEAESKGLEVCREMAKADTSTNSNPRLRECDSLR